MEVESREEPGRQPLHGGWADIGNLHVVEAYRHKRVGTYLIGQAADWLDLARLDRVLDYALAEEHAYDAFLRRRLSVAHSDRARVAAHAELDGSGDRANCKRGAVGCACLRPAVKGPGQFDGTAPRMRSSRKDFTSG